MIHTAFDEFELGGQLDSPFIVCYLALKQNPAYGIALIMEDDNGVELASLLPTEGFAVRDLIPLAIQIVQGLQAIQVLKPLKIIKPLSPLSGSTNR